MKKNILLGSGNGIAPIWNLRLFLAVAIINIFQGVRMVTGEDSIFWEVMGFIMIPVNIALAIFSMLMFSERSKYAPKISINDELISIKEKLLRPAVEISWEHIKDVSFASYKIIFTKEDSDYIFDYRFTTDTSKAIKSAVRELAESKNIKVIEG